MSDRNSKDTILIVDDEPITRMDLTEMFSEAGYDVIGQPSDGFDALELARKQKPDVILMDIKMSVFDGLNAAETIINEGLCDCVVLFTAYNDKDLISKAKRFGVMGYLVKPLDENVLLPYIEIALAKSREIKRMKQGIQKLNQEIEEHKLIETAKSIFANLYSISEGQAYQKIRKLSMDKRSSMADISRSIVKNYSPRTDIERAKALLIEKYNISDSNAFSRIKELSKANDCSISQAAAKIIAEIGKL